MILHNLFYLRVHAGPKGENTGDSQDEDGVEEEEEVGRVNDGDDDEMEDEPQTEVLPEGIEEHWTVSITKKGSNLFTA